MGNLMKKLKKTKMVKQFGILSLVLAMLIGVMSNGTIINAVDGNADANITFNSRIVEKVNGQDVDVSQADSGDSFFLAIYYAVSASTDASKYTECTLSITLPNDIEFDETTDISNTGFDSIEQRTSLGKNILSIKSKELAAGQSGTLYLKMHFKNMTTKNGTTAKFVDMKMTGSMVNENGSYTINPVSVPDASVTAKASQEWTVGKNVIQQADGNNYTIKSIDGKDYYSVDYKVTAAPGSNLTDLGNNYGRLNCTTFELVDTLPVAPAGREDGGAANISIKVGDKVLEEGADKDYELVLNENGTVKAIKIYYISTYESNPDDTNYVPDGAAMLTTYTINANYSKDAYRVLPNEKDDIPFILDNKVELKYLPLGENTPKYVSANAPVNVGWVDENAPTTNLDITKYVTVNGDNSIVGDNKFIFDQEKQDCYYQNTDSRIAFGLYTDEACQNAATDIDGNTVGNSKVIDKDGKVNFAKISEGTYYLKETVGNLPFIGDGVDSANGETIYKIEVKNENNKAVVYLDGKKIENGKLEINNLTTAQGFGYVAFNKVGTSATNSQYGPLAGVKFILTNKVTGDKYETVSNDKGLVLFEGIIAGDYTVEEDFSSAEYDKPDVYKWDVKVEANKVNYPSLMLQDHNTGVAEFKIYYVDSNGSQTITANDGKKYTVSDSGISTKIISGTAVLYDANGKSSKDPGVGYSVFLDPGKEVVLQEVRAPDYYGIIHEWWYVGEIKAQHISEIEVQNYLLTNPIGYKYDEAEKLLAGATMGLFSTETGADRLNKLSQTEIDEVIADSEKWAEYDLVSTAVSTDKYFKFENIDSTQTYYVTELKQPAGYNKNTDIRKVTVEVNGKVYFLKDADTNETVTFINYKYRQIWVSKVLKFAGEQSALTGINFKVYPVVESNESVADAFKIGDKWYIKTGEEVTYTTGTISSGKTGSFMTAPSPAGLYVVEEDITSLPEHVVAPDTTKYLVNLGFDTDNTDLYSDQADASNVIVNTSNYGKLALNKVSSTNSNTYIKATFNIYAKNDEAGHDYSKDTPISTITTNGNQNAVLTDYLKPGNYVLVESLISTDGYVLNPTPREFTIEADKVTGLDGSVYTTVSDAVKNPLVVTNVPKGSVELTKQGTYLDANGLTNPVALSGVNFNVYKSVKLADGTLDLSSTNLVGTAVSQSNGKLQFKVNGTDVTSKKWLEAGDYILQETTVGTTNKNNGFADYAYLGKFTITPGDITKEIVKVDENGNESGKADNVISNTSSYGKLEITKVDHYDKTKKLADVVFEVFNESGILVDTIKTNKNGVARTKLLPAGEYTLKEKSTNNDYFLNDTLYGPYTVEALKVTGTDGKIEITNMMKQSFKVIKKDSHTGKEIDKLDGTTFSLYDAQTDGNLVATATYQKDKGIVFDNLRPNTTYYLQEDISPNGYVIKDSNRIKVTTKTNGEVTTIEVENEPLGSIKIEKISEWSIYGANDSKTTRFPLAGAEFTLYKDVNGDSKLQDDEKVNGIVKNSDTLGIVIFDNLEKGKYLFVETKVPDGYDETVMNDVYAVEVTEGDKILFIPKLEKQMMLKIMVLLLIRQQLVSLHLLKLILKEKV